MLATMLSMLLLSMSLLATSGCHAQVPPPGSKLSPELARRVEILIRQRTRLPPSYVISAGPREKSDVPGFDLLPVTFIAGDGQTSPPLTFLLSTDGKTLGQFNKYDISQDPKEVVTDGGFPARGGPASASVEIVAFDDLECPVCTAMHAALFPALTNRYGSSVRIVYRAFPLVSIHPWAMRAAIDTNCVGVQSATSYWTLVDYLHAHAGEIGLPEKNIARAIEQVDQLTGEQAKKDKLNTEAVAACVKKQDETAIRASMKMGDELGVEATPTMYINGEKLEGLYPIDLVFKRVDSALMSAGKTPPPPYVPPATPPAAPSAAPAAAATPPATK